MSEETAVAEPVVEAEVVAETPEAAALTTALVPTGKQEVIRPLDVEDVVSSMQEYQAMLPRLLDANDYQDAGGDRRFVKKSGWRKIAKAFGLSVDLVGVPHVERDEAGQPLRARVIARAIHGPSGQFSTADGYCSVDEKRFEKDSARQKIENDLCATATTRAKNRAISDLVGMGEVSAEEHDATGATSAGSLPFGPACSEGEANATKKALMQLLSDRGIADGELPKQAQAIWEDLLKSAGDYMPRIAALALVKTSNVIGFTAHQPKPSEGETFEKEMDEAATQAADRDTSGEPEPDRTESGERATPPVADAEVGA